MIRKPEAELVPRATVLSLSVQETARITEVSQLQQKPHWQQGLLDGVRTLGLAVSGKKAF